MAWLHKHLQHLPWHGRVDVATSGRRRHRHAHLFEKLGALVHDPNVLPNPVDAHSRVPFRIRPLLHFHFEPPAVQHHRPRAVGQRRPLGVFRTQNVLEGGVVGHLRAFPLDFLGHDTKVGLGRRPLVHGRLYLHVPFCRQACHYCDFHFSTQTKHMGDLVAAMVQEAHMRLASNPHWKDQTFTTLYLGAEPLHPPCRPAPTFGVWGARGCGPTRDGFPRGHPGGQPRGHDRGPNPGLAGARCHPTQFGVQSSTTTPWLG